MPVRAPAIQLAVRRPLLLSPASLHGPEERCISLLGSPALTRRCFGQVLSFALTGGLLDCSSLAMRLLQFCVSGCDMSTACSIFRCLPDPAPFLWSAVMKGHSQNGSPGHCLSYFRDMLCHGAAPNEFVHPLVFKACKNLGAVSEGKQAHGHMIKSGFSWDVHVGNDLLHLYGERGSLDDALWLYDEMPERNMVSHMLVVDACFRAGNIDLAKSIFDGVAAPDLVLWSALLAGYVHSGASFVALQLFRQMLRAGNSPDHITMVSVFSACVQLGDHVLGRQAHGCVERSGMKMNNVGFTALLSMYINSDLADDALKIFENITHKDVVSWNSLITGFSENGRSKEALEVFRRMIRSGMKPDRVTFLGVLPSCAQVGAIETGREIECMVQSNGIHTDLMVVTSLMDIPGDARRLFDSLHLRDVFAWTSIIGGYAMNGNWEEANSHFRHMLAEGIRPNEVTFLSLLASCSHKGLVSEELEYFKSMTQDHLIEPKMEHYACLVDLLGRAGSVDEAKRFIDNMPLEPGPNVWGSLIGACATHKNIHIGEYAYRHLTELEPAADANYVFLSNLCAATNRWEEVASTRTKMESHLTRKAPGCSWIVVEGEIHEFLAGDMTHQHAYGGIG
ncbi:hypothetical protein Taro_019814 [Colocasia esculenta]|uniref:Pentatricopeptide repeat-containing protein n=1 Tax=Colocasia esculenta TaxID=4460 RepID=A0A843UUH9_COLES|nr:hypothetical protein [Colocasia esculenta]